MKLTCMCPKCQCRQLWCIQRVMQPHPDSSSAAFAMVVGTMSTSWERQDAGWFELWVCSRCGFSEWYATVANDGLAKLAQNPASGVRWVDGSQGKPPYR